MTVHPIIGADAKHELLLTRIDDAPFEEGKHKRFPKGDPRGGKFAPKGGGKLDLSEIKFNMYRALSDYGNHTHWQVNSLLRYGTYEKSPDFIGRGLPRGSVAEQDARSIIRSLDRALATEGVAPRITAESVVYRGVDSRELHRKLEKSKGKVVSDKGFLSTSRSREIAERAADMSFYDEKKPSRVVLEITLPRGTPYLRGRSDEREVLLDRNSKLKVTRVSEDWDHKGTPILLVRAKLQPKVVRDALEDDEEEIEVNFGDRLMREEAEVEDAYPEFEEEKHERHPKGDPRGGQFAPKMRSAPRELSSPPAGHPGPQYSEEAWIDADGRIRTGDVKDAVRALYENRDVVLQQPRQVSALIERLAAVGKRMERLHGKAANFNLCHVMLEGSSLFCTEVHGIPRVAMPQLRGDAVPGSIAATMPLDVRGRVDATELFKLHLVEQGYEIDAGEEYASYLRPTQNELNGAVVSTLMRDIREGRLPEQTIFITKRDQYILDGHHRWAAQVAVDFADNAPDIKVPVTHVDAGIIELMALAKKFARDVGIKQEEQAYPTKPRARDAEFEEEKHERHPKGDPRGGQFASKSGDPWSSDVVTVKFKDEGGHVWEKEFHVFRNPAYQAAGRIYFHETRAEHVRSIVREGIVPGAGPLGGSVWANPLATFRTAPEGWFKEQDAIVVFSGQPIGKSEQGIEFDAIPPEQIKEILLVRKLGKDAFPEFREEQHERFPKGHPFGGRFMENPAGALKAGKEQQSPIALTPEEHEALEPDWSKINKPHQRRRIQESVSEYIFDSIEINEELRAGDPLDWATGPQQIHIRRLDEAFRQVGRDMPRDTVLYRGINDTRAAALKVGMEFVDRGFISTSPGLLWAKTFADDGGTLVHITVPKGARVLNPVTEFVDHEDFIDTAEPEILLPRGSKFRVDHVEPRHVWVTKL